MKKEDRIAKARELRGKGYNCAQAVVMCFEDITGIPENLAASMTSALGAGVAATGEICGVANAMAIVVGATYSPDAENKGKASAEARGVVGRFACENGNCLRCLDLKGKGRSCNDLVAQGVELLDEHFALKSHS